MTPNWFDAPEFPRQASPNKPKIPAERELARELYVSVTTIRTALKALEQEGKIEHAPGRWTICAIATLGPFFSFAQEMKLRLTT
jgi:DNA-binding GntR family transcriptional regulator